MKLRDYHWRGMYKGKTIIGCMEQADTNHGALMSYPMKSGRKVAATVDRKLTGEIPREIGLGINSCYRHFDAWEPTEFQFIIIIEQSFIFLIN